MLFTKNSRIHRQCFSDFQTSIFDVFDSFATECCSQKIAGFTASVLATFRRRFLTKKTRNTVCILFNFLWLKCCFTSTETVGLLGTGAQDGHLDFHTAPELWILIFT